MATADLEFKTLNESSQIMPLITIQVTEDIKEGTEKEALLKAISEIISRQIGKPETYCMATISKSDIMMGGAVSPAAFIDVRSIGGLPASVNKGISSEVSFLLSNHLEVPKDRIYLNFTEFSPSNWGWNGGTF